jgi:hypothetical protein
LTDVLSSKVLLEETPRIVEFDRCKMVEFASPAAVLIYNAWAFVEDNWGDEYNGLLTTDVAVGKLDERPRIVHFGEMKNPRRCAPGSLKLRESIQIRT